MRERINVIFGKNPVLLIAPHGADEVNTDVIAEETAIKCSSYSVTNKGFKRGNQIDLKNQIADCNKVPHCLNSIVLDEYLNPIIRIRTKIKNKIKLLDDIENQKMLVLHILGTDDDFSMNNEVAMILGYGLGSIKNSLTCDMWVKNLFISLWYAEANKRKISSKIYEATSGNKYSGRDYSEMNQYFKKYIMDNKVNSMQLHIPLSMRDTKEKAMLASEMLSNTLSIMMLHDETDSVLYESLSFKKFI